MTSTRLSRPMKLVAVALMLAAIPSYSQVQAAQNRIRQQVVINGQTVNAVSVVAEGGGLQTYRCLNPQQYRTLDGTAQGWACYDQSAGVWLLNAVPPAEAQAPQPQPQVQQPQVQQAPIQQAPIQQAPVQQFPHRVQRNLKPFLYQGMEPEFSMGCESSR